MSDERNEHNEPNQPNEPSEHNEAIDDLPGEAGLRAIDLDVTQPRPRGSALAFPDGGRYRFEIPSVETPAALDAVIAEARDLGVLIHRVSQGSGVMLLTDSEITDMVAAAEQAQIELCLFLGPRGTWDIGSFVKSSSGGSGARARGRDQLGQSIADAERAVALGVRCLLVTDEGVLWALHRLRATGQLPADLVLKTSILMAPANPASFVVITGLGADSINVPTDLTITHVAEFRAASTATLDFYVEAPDDVGGYIRFYDIPELVRVGAPIYLKFGLRNAPGIYPVGRHLAVAAVETARERVRRARIGLDVLQRSGLAEQGSPAGARSHLDVKRLAGP